MLFIYAWFWTATKIYKLQNYAFLIMKNFFSKQYFGNIPQYYSASKSNQQRKWFMKEITKQEIQK